MIMTYQECDRALQRYHCYFDRDDNGKRFKINNGRLDVLQHYSHPVDTLALSDNAVGHVYTDVGHFSINGRNFSGSRSSLKGISHLLYQLAMTPAEKRYDSQNTIAVRAIVALAKQVGSCKRRHTQMSNRDLDVWIGNTLASIEENLVVSNKVEPITESSGNSAPDTLSETTDAAVDSSADPEESSSSQASSSDTANDNQLNTDNDSDVPDDNHNSDIQMSDDSADTNTDADDAEKSANRKIRAYLTKNRFAKGILAKTDLVPMTKNKKGTYILNYKRPYHNYDDVFAAAFHNALNSFKQDSRFQVTNDGSLILKKGNQLIKDNTILVVHTKNKKSQNDAVADLRNNGLLHDDNKNGGKQSKESKLILSQYIVTDACINYLASLDSWDDIANGQFVHMVIYDLGTLHGLNK